MYFALLLYVSYNFRVILCYWMFNTFLCLLILYTWDTMFCISESDSDINDMVCRNLKKMMFLSVLNIIMWRQNDRFFPVSDSVRWYWHTTLCDKVGQWLAAGMWISPGTPVSSTNNTDSHDITEILLKVAINTINQQNQPQWVILSVSTDWIWYWKKSVILTSHDDV
jgi:hypothetical protein